MTSKQPGRVLVGLSPAIGAMLRARAKDNYRSISAEATMLIERGLKAEAAGNGSNSLFST
jgi:hypothetical protein